MKTLLVFVMLFFVVGRAEAITPQKYCESLAATSCEVLNFDFIAPNSAITSTFAGLGIKYCRDRVFKVITYKMPGNNGTPYGFGSGPRDISLYDAGGFGDISTRVSLDNNLCSAVMADPRVGGNSSVLP